MDAKKVKYASFRLLVIAYGIDFVIYLVVYELLKNIIFIDEKRLLIISFVFSMLYFCLFL